MIEDHVKNIRTIVARTNHFNFMAIENTFGGGWTCVERHTFKEEITEERLVSVASLIEEIIPTSGFLRSEPLFLPMQTWKCIRVG